LVLVGLRVAIATSIFVLGKNKKRKFDTDK
jgi:hypothetical protein